MENKELMNVRQESVDRFLVQQELRKRLSAVDAGAGACEPSAEDAAAREECARRVRPFDKDIEAGQIRMLSGTERPTYALVARRWDENSWLLLPFSNYSEPATETEMKLRPSGGIGLRVLQLWNARSLLEQTVAKSWLVAELSAEDIEDALGAWKWSVGVGELSEDQLSRTGLPIMRRDDPRISYEDEELTNFKTMDAEDMSRLEWLESVQDGLDEQELKPFVFADVFREDYALAAGEAVNPVAADCLVPGFDGSVNVRYVPAENKLHIRVFAPDGTRSKDLDGRSVFGGGANMLGVISGGDFACVLKSQFDGVVCLADADGNVVPLLSDGSR